MAGASFSRVLAAAAVLLLTFGCTPTTSSQDPPTPSQSPTVAPTATSAPAPAWAPAGMSGEDVQEIAGLMEQGLEDRGLSPTVDLEDGTIKVDNQTLGLTNIVQTLAQEPSDEWAAAVDKHLDAALGAVASGQPKTFAAAARDLRVALYEAAYLDQYGSSDGDGVVAREVAKGLFAAVVFDQGGAVQVVTDGQARAWGASEEKLFQRATQNTLGGRPPQALIEQGFGLVNQGFYATSWLLEIDELLEDPAPDGVLVVVPRRGELVFHPLTPSTDAAVLQALADGAVGSYIEGPNPVSDDVYWWREGEVTTIATRSRGSRVQIAVPPRLARLLRG